MSYLQEAGDQKRYAQEAEKLGFKLERTSGKHEIWKHKSGAQVPAPKTGSDRRGFLNFRRDLKRALRNSLPTKPDKVKPEAIPPNKNRADKVVDAVKTTRLSPAQRRIVNRSTTSGTPTTFSAFMNRLKPQSPSLQQRMSQGYSNTLKSLPLSVKADMGNEIIKRMRYKPTQGHGISNIRLADEYVPEDISRGLRAVHYGTQYAGKKAVPFITTHALSMLPKLKALETVPKNIAPMSSVITTGIGAGMALSKVLNPLAQRRREEQQKRREQLIPSGNQPYGTGRVAQLKQI